MKILFSLVFLGALALGQSTYSGKAQFSGATAYTGASCGPQNGYACFVQDTNVHNYSMPGPSFGANTCNWTSPATVETCGNLTGANTSIVPPDFRNAIIRCTDAATVAGHPEYIWTMYDSPSTNAWNVNDTGVLLKVTGSGTQYLMKFDPNALTCSPLSDGGGNPVYFSGNAWFSHSDATIVYWFDGMTQTQLKQSTVNYSTGAVTTSVLYDFNSPACLANPVNGYGSSFPEGGGYWAGGVTSDMTDTSFARAFSTGNAQETGVYLAAWSPGQAGCDLWNTSTNVITHNGVLLGTVSDAPWGGAYGGKFDTFYIHAAAQTPNGSWIYTTPSPNGIIYGEYNDGNNFWQRGTTNVTRCGIGAPNWKASTAFNAGERVSPTTGNAGGYIYQIITTGGTSGAAAPSWGQTPGQDTVESTGLTWRNVGLGTAQQFFCDGHPWVGYTGLAPGKHLTMHSYSNPISPGTQLLNVASAGDQHMGDTNANPTDSTWIFVMSADVGTGVNLLDPNTPYPSALYNELYLISPPYNPDGTVNTSRTFRRAAHTWNSGWHQTFDVQNAMAVISQTGKFAMVSSDAMGQLGNINGTASCNVGAPDWVKNATGDGTTTYAVGYLAFPNPVNGGNTGDYLYQIQSCAGACATGTTKPAFPQTGGATVVDGTITWVNTGNKQNCRADDFVVKLTR